MDLLDRKEELVLPEASDHLVLPAAREIRAFRVLADFKAILERRDFQVGLVPLDKPDHVVGLTSIRLFI